MDIKENDIVLCTVKRIERTTVFLEIEGNGEGTMSFSEVAAGRIRNIRDFIAMNKKVVCKILRIKDNNIELSLRRVTAKEREEVLENYQKEKTLVSILKPILKDKTTDIIKKIKEENNPADFLDEAKENPSILKNFVSGSELEQLKKILSEKKEKDKKVKKIILLKSDKPSGIKDIKEILKTESAEISYLGASKFLIEIKAKDYKIANSNLEKALAEINAKAKKLNAKFEIKDN